MIVIETVIVHVHGNDTVEVIATVDERAPQWVNGSDGVHVQVHGHGHGPDHVNVNVNVNANANANRSLPARRGIVRNHETFPSPLGRRSRPIHPTARCSRGTCT